MSSADKNSKTEDPTPKRLQEARSEGRIAKSPELATWIAIFIGVTIMKMTFMRAANMLSGMMREMATLIATPDAQKLARFMAESILDGFVAIVPLIIFFSVLAIVSNVAQVRFVLAYKAVKPSFSKINPINGFKRIFSSASFFQAGKELLKFIVFAAIAYDTLYGTVTYLSQGGIYSLTELMRATVEAALLFVRNVAMAGIIIGLIDYLFQRRKTKQGLKMTKQEVKEESRSQDLAPEVRGKMRMKQRQMSRNRMMAAIKDADVVVVNPVHIAIALKYDAKRGAPRVVAKGAGFIAEKIREQAETNNVPLVQDIPLARALHRACDVDDEIPSALFEAVAKLLAFVFGLKARGQGLGLHKMPGTPELEEVDRIETSKSALLTSR